jgi:small nuclear ribonucleoprotein (snRNP)-like protein
MEQPFDTLNAFRDKVVVVTKKNGEEVVGRLVAYDLNMNITMETTKGTEFINGFAVDIIMLRQEE